MKVLSLFDGISCARVALERAGIPVEHYLTSEIDKYAIQISDKNYPDCIRVGDVRSINSELIEGQIGLLIGGSPCQDLSIAKKNRQGLNGERSGLFWEYVRILKEVKPKYFILENVASMSKESKDTITKALGVEPIMINASLVSAQNRKRLFWTNIPNVTQPEDRNIFLKDILEKDVDSKYNINISEKYGLKGLCDNKAKSLTASCWKGYGNDGVSIIRIGQFNKGGQGDRIYSQDGKSVSLSANGGGRGAKTGLYAVSIRGRYLENGQRKDIKGAKTTQRLEIGGAEKAHTITKVLKDSLVMQDFVVRKLTPVECERLQGLPDNYTEGVSNTQRYKMLGNAFNVDVVAHILSFIPDNAKKL